MKSRARSGHACGQSHYKAKLTDADVREMRRLHEQWVDAGRPAAKPSAGTRSYGYVTLSKIFGCSVSAVRDITQYITRASA